MNKHVARRKQRGQALIIAAGAIIALIALVALAVDGGNAYAQRRIAQNAADGAALAGATQMRNILIQNTYTDTSTNPAVKKVYPMTSLQNQSVLAVIQQSLQASGVASTEAAGYIGKYTDNTGQVYAAAPVIGSNQSVAFYGGSGAGSYGAIGVSVQTVATADTYFARLIGQPTVSASATGDGKIESVDGILKASDPTHTDNPLSNTAPRLWPLVIMNTTVNVNSNSLTSLYSFNTTYSGGNWGALCYDDDNCGQRLVNDWYKWGFDPSTGTRVAHDVTSGSTTVPGTHETINFLPLGYDGFDHNTLGTWINGKQGNGSSSECHDVFPVAAANHWTVLIPIADYTNGLNGSNLMYHVVNVAAFKIDHIDCPGNGNAIVGQFVGWGWSAGQVTWGGDLNRSIQFGQVGARLGR